MYLPNGDRAIVDPTKVRDYCLSPDHPRGKHKAKVFESVLGLTQSRFGVLCDALADAARDQEAIPGKIDAHGSRYVIDFDMTVDDRTARVRSGWIIRTEEDLPRLTTCYVA